MRIRTPKTAALGCLLAAVVVTAGTERLKDHLNLRDNIEKAKKLTAKGTGQDGALTEDELNCICKMLGLDASAGGSTEAPTIFAGTCLPESTAGQMESTTVDNTPTETKRKPWRIKINNDTFGKVKQPCEYPQDSGVAPFTLWFLAEVLAHEKDHFNNPNDTWDNGAGGEDDGAATGGDRCVKSHTEHRAYCRSKKVIEAGIKQLDKAKSDGKITKFQHKHLKGTYFTPRLEFVCKKKDKYKLGTKESAIKECEKKEHTSRDVARCTDPVPEGPPPDDIDDLDGPSTQSGIRTLRCAAFGYDRETTGKFGVDGLERRQPYWVGITAKKNATYDDNDMVVVSFDYAQVAGTNQQLQGHFSFWKLDTKDSDEFRLTLFFWATSVVVDWDDPDFPSATRLDLDGINLYDYRTQANAAGDTIRIDARYMVEEAEFRVYVEGPASTQMEIVSYRLDANGNLPTNGDVLATVTTDANGNATADVSVPQGGPGISSHVALKAEWTGDEVGVMLDFSPVVSGDESNLGLSARDNDDHQFTIDIGSITRQIGETNATLRFGLLGFADGWNARIFATRKDNGAYDDNDAVELTIQAETIGEHGVLFLDIPCTYTSGQAYRLAACVWPPGVPPNGQHMSQTVRLDIEDVIPYFTAATHELDELDNQIDYGAIANDNWAYRSQDVEIKVFVDDAAGTADVSLHYEVGIEGVFDTQNPVTVGTTQTLQPGEEATSVLTAPNASDVEVLRVVITYTSPTSAFPAFTQELGLAVFPIDE